MGQPDYGIGRDAMIAHVSVLASATDLPLSADRRMVLAMLLRRPRKPFGLRTWRALFAVH